MVVSSLIGQHYNQRTPDHLLEDEDDEKIECQSERHCFFLIEKKTDVLFMIGNYT